MQGDRATQIEAAAARQALEAVAGPDPAWIDELGGHPPYLRLKIDELRSGGMSYPQAQRIMLRQFERWAGDLGDVTPETRELAAEALVQWAALRESKEAALRAVQPVVLRYIQMLEDERVQALRDLETERGKPAVADNVVAYIDALEDERDALRARLARSVPQPSETAPVPPEVVAYVESLEDEADALRAALAAVDPGNALLVDEDPTYEIPEGILPPILDRPDGGSSAPKVG